MTESSNEGLCYRQGQDEDDPHEVGSDPGCPCWEDVKSVKSLGQILAEEEVSEQSLREAFDEVNSLKAFKANVKSMDRLDPADPFDKVLIEIRNMNRKKRADYAADSDIFSNFRDTASMLGLPGFTERESALFLILVKVARLKSLRANGRMDNPANESVVDTVLDLAVYAIIYLALMREYENYSHEHRLKAHDLMPLGPNRRALIDNMLRNGFINEKQAKDFLR